MGHNIIGTKSQKWIQWMNRKRTSWHEPAFWSISRNPIRSIPLAHVTKSVTEVNRDMNGLMFRWTQIIIKMKREKNHLNTKHRLIPYEYFVQFKVSCFIIILMKCCEIHCVVSLRKRLSHLNIIHSSIPGSGSLSDGLWCAERADIIGIHHEHWNRF